ncbi:MAG: hypothetical protein WA632_00835 [Gallionella sp.]
MRVNIRNNLSCVILVSILATSSNLLWAAEKCPEGSSNVGAVGGGCLLGASVGTFIFPGVGTAVGCAAVGLGSWVWKLLGSSASEAKPDCVDHASKLPPSKTVDRSDTALAKLPE